MASDVLGFIAWSFENVRAVAPGGLAERGLQGSRIIGAEIVGSSPPSGGAQHLISARVQHSGAVDSGLFPEILCTSEKPTPWRCDGGRGGIRTHGGLAPTAVFKTAALNHSATLPVSVQCRPDIRFARGLAFPAAFCGRKGAKDAVKRLETHVGGPWPPSHSRWKNGEVLFVGLTGAAFRTPLCPLKAGTSCS